MQAQALLVLQDCYTEAFAFESIADAQALLKKAGNTYYGNTWKLFKGTVAEFLEAYSEDADEVEDAVTFGIDDANTVGVITRDVAATYIAAGKDIWDLQQDCETGENEALEDAHIMQDNF